MSDLSELTEAAESFRNSVDSYRNAQFAASDHLRLLHYVIGFALIAVSAVVGGSVLQASDGNPSRTLTLTAGILSIIVVVLTTVQTSFKPGERAELHRTAANGFGKIRNKLDIFIGRPHTDIAKAWDELTTIVEEIGSVEAGAPGYLERTYNEANKELRRDLEDRRNRSGH